MWLLIHSSVRKSSWNLISVVVFQSKSHWNSCELWENFLSNLSNVQRSQNPHLKLNQLSIIRQVNHKAVITIATKLINVKWFSTSLIFFKKLEGKLRKVIKTDKSSRTKLFLRWLDQHSAFQTLIKTVALKNIIEVTWTWKINKL